MELFVYCTGSNTAWVALCSYINFHFFKKLQRTLIFSLRGNSPCQTAVLHVHPQDVSVGTTFSQQVFSLPLLYQNYGSCSSEKAIFLYDLIVAVVVAIALSFTVMSRVFPTGLGTSWMQSNLLFLLIWKWPNHFWDCEINANVIFFSCPKPSKTKINNNRGHLIKHSTLWTARFMLLSPSFPQLPCASGSLRVHQSP